MASSPEVHWQRALEISILMMLLPSFLMGCLPNYDTFGYGSTPSRSTYTSDLALTLIA